MMRKKVYVLLLIILVTTNLSVSKNNNKSKQNKHYFNKTNSKDFKSILQNERIKRSINDEEDKPFWANRGKKESEENVYGYTKYRDSHETDRSLRLSDQIEKEPPFWGNRGRRESSEENYIDDSYQSSERKPSRYSKYCKHCNDPFYKLLKQREANKKERIEESPFWGNRGRRNSDEDEEKDSPFWGNRGRRQEEDDPFWGNRGRREDSFSDNRIDNTPFWGNRGRREEEEPFWGNRGRRHDEDPFWGNRGRRRDLKETLLQAIDIMKNDIEHLYKEKKSFWNNQGREATLKHLFRGTIKNEYPSIKARALRDDRMFAEEPHYIVVDRTSRSSGEEDPFFISRGKKKITSYDWMKAARNRRGAIEDIFKTVKSDPYFIARGKKDMSQVKINNTTISNEELSKVKDLVCSTMELMLAKHQDKVKKEDIDDRGRRAVLQKLAAQLQNDPYFVSRGKKDSLENEDDVTDFISGISEMCY